MSVWVSLFSNIKDGFKLKLRSYQWSNEQPCKWKLLNKLSCSLKTAKECCKCFLVSPDEHSSLVPFAGCSQRSVSYNTNKQVGKLSNGDKKKRGEHNTHPKRPNSYGMTRRVGLTSKGRGFPIGKQGLTEGHHSNRGRERRTKRTGRGWLRGAEWQRGERKRGKAGAGGGCCCRGNATELVTRFCQKRREGRKMKRKRRKERCVTKACGCVLGGLTPVVCFFSTPCLLCL